MERKMIDVVKGIMEKYNSNIKEIEHKYSKPQKLMDLEEAIKRSENDIQDINAKIEQLKRNTIMNESKEINRQKEECIQKNLELIQQRDNYIKENEFNVQERIERDKQKIKELNNNETNTRKQLNEAKKEGKEFLNSIENDIQKTLIEMKKVKESIENSEDRKDTKLENDMSNDIKFKQLKELYIKLKESKQDIENAVKYCEDSLEIFKEKDNKKIQEMNEFLKDNKLKYENKTKGEPKQESKKEEKAKEEPKQESKKEEKTKEEPKQENKKEEKTKEEPKQENKKEEKAKEEPKQESKKEEKAKEEPKKESKKEEKAKEETKQENKKEEKTKEEPKQENKKEEKAKEEPKKESKKEEKAKEEPKKESKKEEKAKEEPKQESKTKEPLLHKTKIILDIYANKITIEGKEDLFYKEETKRKKELMERYNIKSFLEFPTIRKQMKNIDYALISALEKIDDENKTLVQSYIYVKAGKLYPEEAKKGMEILKKYVDIDYIFEKSFFEIAAKKSARMDSELGIASLYGINKKGIFDEINERGIKVLNGIKEGTKNFFSKTSKKLFKRKETPKALDENSKIAEDIVNGAMNVMEKTKENQNTKKTETQQFREEIDAGDKVKVATENVSKEYKEKENSGNEEKIHRLKPSEYEELTPEEWKDKDR